MTGLHAVGSGQTPHDVPVPAPELQIGNFPAMVHSIDGAGRLMAVSEIRLEKLGYRREEVIGRRSSEFLTAESRRHAVDVVLPEFFRTGRCENIQYQMVCKDGRIIDVLLSANLEKDAAGAPLRSLAILTDVTAQKAAERRLVESEERYRGLIEDQSEYVSLARPDGMLRFVNDAYARLHRKHPDEMVGTNLYDYIPVEGRAAVALQFERFGALNESLENENQVILPDGQTRWIAWTNRALRDADGHVSSIHSVGRDVERRVVAERRLKDSEAAYRLLAENSTDMILTVRQDGTRTYASPACRTILGYEPEEMLHLSTQDSIHPEDLPAVHKCLSRSKEERTILTYRLRRRDGSYVWVESVTRLIEGEAGQPPQRLVVSRDIDRRVAAEQRLKESEERYRLLAEYGTDMVFQLDLDLVRRYVSPACREILGYEPEELVDIKPVSMVHPEDAERLSLVLQIVRSGLTERHSVINRIRHRDGRWIWVEAQLRTLRDPKTGAPCGVIGALRDISGRKAVEDQLAAANQRLEVLAREGALTGLANRRAFDEALSIEYKRVKRGKASLGLILLDVDHFKLFNDQYGHKAGDDCLKRVAAAIKGALLRPGDMAARYGGEEFVVLLPDTDEAGAASIAERVRSAVKDLQIEHCVSAFEAVTVSIGVAAVAHTPSSRTAAHCFIPPTLLSIARKQPAETTSCARLTCRRRLPRNPLLPREALCELIESIRSDKDAGLQRDRRDLPIPRDRKVAFCKMLAAHLDMLARRQVLQRKCIPDGA